MLRCDELMLGGRRIRSSEKMAKTSIESPFTDVPFMRGNHGSASYFPQKGGTVAPYTQNEPWEEEKRGSFGVVTQFWDYMHPLSCYAPPLKKLIFKP